MKGGMKGVYIGKGAEGGVAYRTFLGREGVGYCFFWGFSCVVCHALGAAAAAAAVAARVQGLVVLLVHVERLHHRDEAAPRPCPHLF